MTYPFTIAKILDDATYIAYGGQTGSSTPAMRNASYFIAEELVSRDLEMLLYPAIITGTYYPKLSDRYFLTEYCEVKKFVLARLYGFNDTLLQTISGTSTNYLNVRNWELGQIDINYSRIGFIPYRLDYVIEIGSTGTAQQPNVLLALAGYANIILNEMIGYGNESVGDAGVQEFSNQQYRERRTYLLRTAYGSSAKANFIHGLLSGFRKHRASGIGV